ncbi:MAG TPA: hypothetical protein VGD62_12795 [Acidobacteriaceae bacterium]
MIMRGAGFFAITLLSLSLAVARAQSAQSLVQQAVDTERSANRTDHSAWTYREAVRKPKEQIVQWVAVTPQGGLRRVTETNGQRVQEPQQREQVEKYLADSGAQKKQAAESRHDDQQVDDFLTLLPTAFLWTQTGATATETTLHFEPKPNFHAPTREARVFSGMVGDLVLDNSQHRIRSMSGHLVHDVTFGGGLLGRLRQGSSFSLEQAEEAPGAWQLTAIHVHLDGNALLFKSVSLEEDDARSKFALEAQTLTLQRAATLLLEREE